MRLLDLLGHITHFASSAAAGRLKSSRRMPDRAREERPDIVAPMLGVYRNRVRAVIADAEDPGTANARVAKFAEGDLGAGAALGSDDVVGRVAQRAQQPT
jgi:hypothetical protein